MGYLGEIVALSVAAMWTVTALCFEFAGNRVGSLTVNILRLISAFVMLGLMLLVTTGSLLPTHADTPTWLWMCASGAVGFVFGDLCLFYSYTIITARFSQLMMTLAPPFAAIFGWAILGEGLSPMALLGMAVTLSGIAISILKRDPSRATTDALVAGTSNLTVVVGEHSGKNLAERSGNEVGDKNSAQVETTSNSTRTTSGKRTHLRLQLQPKGVLLGIGGALGQGLGIVLSKKGMIFYQAAAEGSAVADYIPFAATQMRIITGIVGFALIIILSGRLRGTIAALKDRKSMGAIFTGSIFGPFLGVSLSLMAVNYTSTAVASTIMATTPILILIPYVLFYKKKVTRAEVIGAALSVAGVSLFFM